MTEEEKRDVIEKAAREAREAYGKMLGEPRLARWHDADSRPAWMKTTEAALEAVDHFTLRDRLDTLVEAADDVAMRGLDITATYHLVPPSTMDALRTALTAAKDQTNDG
jgi:hypothetical protein